jgi:hypothetical protein
MRRVVALIIATCGLLACARSRPSVASSQSANASSVWQLHLALDSASGRTPLAHAAVGTVTVASKQYVLDFVPLLGYSLPNQAQFSVIKQTDTPGGLRYELVLGDQRSDHAKVILIGRDAGRDSIVGTWTEQRYCCGAAGRFALWLPRQ